jgi:hypothetical protein
MIIEGYRNDTKVHSDDVDRATVEVRRPYGCLTIKVDGNGVLTLEAQDGEGEVLATHEIDPDQHVYPPIHKETHDLGVSGGG